MTIEEKTRLIEQKIRLVEQRYIKEITDSWKRNIEERKENLKKKYQSIDEYWSDNK